MVRRRIAFKTFYTLLLNLMVLLAIPAVFDLAAVKKGVDKGIRHGGCSQLRWIEYFVGFPVTKQSEVVLPCLVFPSLARPGANQSRTTSCSCQCCQQRTKIV